MNSNLPIYLLTWLPFQKLIEVLLQVHWLQVFIFVLQINKLDKAVAAANTFFLANPDHVEMKQNLDYYRMMAGVQEEDFRDLEASPHMVSSCLLIM